jgi:Methyltransferase domain
VGVRPDVLVGVRVERDRARIAACRRPFDRRADHVPEVAQCRRLSRRGIRRAFGLGESLRRSLTSSQAATWSGSVDRDCVGRDHALARVVAVPAPSRYDEIADFYVAEVGDSVTDPGTTGLLELVGDVRGKRLLDVACGQGRVSRALGRRQARVVGLDLSAPLIEQARTAERYDPLGSRTSWGTRRQPTPYVARRSMASSATTASRTSTTSAGSSIRSRACFALGAGSCVRSSILASRAGASTWRVRGRWELATTRRVGGVRRRHLRRSVCGLARITGLSRRT